MTVDEILKKCVNNRIDAPFMGCHFYDLPQAKKDLYKLILEKLPEKKTYSEYHGAGYNEALDEVTKTLERLFQ